MKRAGLFIVLWLMGFSTWAQYRTVDSYSFFTGYSFMKSDFGARNDWNTNINNTGVELGGKIFLNLFPFHWQWQGMYHFRTNVIFDISYGRVDHIGKWTEGKTGPIANKLRNMYAKPFTVGVGFGMEYSLQDLQYFNFTRLYGIYRFNVSIGVDLMGFYYTPNIASNLGDITDPVEQFNILHPRFVGKIYPQSGFTFGTTFKLSFHYQINESYHIYLENRATWFASDKIDGLDVNDEPDKFNDWLFTPAFGIIYFIW
jgi:hypothetical protein